MVSKYFKDNNAGIDDCLIMEYNAICDDVFKSKAPLDAKVMCWFELNAQSSYDNDKTPKDQTTRNSVSKMRKLIEVITFMSDDDDKKYINEYRFFKNDNDVSKDEWQLELERILKGAIETITKIFVENEWLVTKKRKHDKEVTKKPALSLTAFCNKAVKLKKIIKMP